MTIHPTRRAAAKAIAKMREQNREMNQPILTQADNLVEVIVSDVREAIYERAIQLAEGDQLTQKDIKQAYSELFPDSLWRPSVTERLVQ